MHAGERTAKTRRRLLAPSIALLASVAGGTAACSDEAPPRAREQARNVVLIVIDTLRADRLGCYGWPRETSPAIDWLAETGTLFERNYSQGCWTVPSMISMMSGVSVTTEETALSPQLTVLAEALQAKDVATAAFVGNSVLWKDRGFERGFGIFEQDRGSALELAERFAAWCEARTGGERDRRFFAWVHFKDPHHPYEPLPEYDLFDGPRPDVERLLPRWQREAANADSLAGDAPSLDFELALARMQEHSNRYDGEVRMADAGVQRVIDALRETGELEETLIIVCSDHGEMLYEQLQQPGIIDMVVEREGGLPEGVADLFARGHRPWYYEELWNTPLVLRGPGVPAGERRSALSANLDLFPTVLHAFDLPVLPWLEGRSLFGEGPSHERVFAYGHRTTAVIEDTGRKLVVQPRKLYPRREDGSAPLQLFDLSSDPHEDRDLAEVDPDASRRLLDEIDRWRDERAREVIETTTAEQLEILRELGYVGAGGVEVPEEDAPPR